MIVRCKNCNSAFAVDDDKVSGKKFAFSCLKCGTENIIDNRLSEKSEDPEFITLPDMEADFSADKIVHESLPDNAISPDDEISIDDIDSTDYIPETLSNGTSADSDLFTDDEILSFQDEDEIEIEIGDEINGSEVIFDDIEENDPTEKEKDEPKINRQEDIDELFATVTDSGGEGTADDKEPFDLNSIDLEFETTDSDEITSTDETEDEFIVPENDISTDDDIDIDLAELDIDIDESDDITDEESSADGIALDFDEDDLTLDLDKLDIDLDEESLPVIDNEILSDSSADSDDDLEINIDDLDIELDESPSSVSGDILSDSDKDLALNPDVLDIDIDQAPLHEDEDQQLRIETADDDEDLTINLDELDIDLDDISDSDEKTEIFSKNFSNSDEEDLTLNLNELDIELEDETIKTSLEEMNGKGIQDDPPLDEDESITIDLDTLDIDFAEDAVSTDLSDHDDEEKLTIDDAGITFDELTKDKSPVAFKENDEDDIKFSIEEVDPDSGLHAIIDNSTPHEIPVIDTLNELPEIDLDEYEDYLTRDKSADEKKAPLEDDNEINFDDIEIIPIDDDFDLYSPDDDCSAASIPARGTTTLSIDFSLKYSRLEALLRLTGLYMISLVPNLIVLLLYLAVSAILGFINQVVILFTGRCLEDFSQISENTLRHFISIKANITGIVEDRPVFSGKENLNHQLQMNITYPIKYSKNIAILRLSIVGILLFTLPHLAIVALLTVAVPFAFIAGLIIVIATGRWPWILFTYLTKYFRYLARLLAFIIGLNDEYPPFRME